MEDLHFEEIRLSRELMRVLEKSKWRLDKESYEAYRALLALYEQQKKVGSLLGTSRVVKRVRGVSYRGWKIHPKICLRYCSITRRIVRSKVAKKSVENVTVKATTLIMMKIVHTATELGTMTLEMWTLMNMTHRLVDSFATLPNSKTRRCFALMVPKKVAKTLKM